MGVVVVFWDIALGLGKRMAGEVGWGGGIWQQHSIKGTGSR